MFFVLVLASIDPTMSFTGTKEKSCRNYGHKATLANITQQ